MLFVICVGDPFDGMRLYGDDANEPFISHDEATIAAEELFRDEPWRIVPLGRVSCDNEDTGGPYIARDAERLDWTSVID